MAEDFLSGRSGELGRRSGIRAAAQDAVLDLARLALLEPARLARAARGAGSRRVLVLGVDRPEGPGLMASALQELRRSRHELTNATGPGAPGLGKFENLNHQLELHPPVGHDWALVVDDDVVLPRGFLDAFVFLAERFELRLAQPAHRRRSHAAWEVTRRQRAVVRETSFVEIGPVTALHAETFEVLLPFPPLRMGWGLDSYWGAVARERGWRAGVVDATAIAHRSQPIATDYPREDAVAEARAFLESRPYVRRVDAERTLARHRSWTAGSG